VTWDDVAPFVVALFIVVSTGMMTALAWGLSNAWKTSALLAKLESTIDDHERRIGHLEDLHDRTAYRPGGIS